jgi:ATP-dependent Clp protease ATP-binding subunit ClpC
MLHVFEQAQSNLPERTFSVLVRFTAAEFTAVIAGAAIEWSARVTSFGPRRMPGRVLDTVSEGQRGASNQPSDIQIAQDRVTFLLRRMEFAIANHQFQNARLYSEEERQAREHLRLVRLRYETGDTESQRPC